MCPKQGLSTQAIPPLPKAHAAGSAPEYFITMSTQTILQSLRQSRRKLSSIPIVSTWYRDHKSDPDTFPSLPNELIHTIFTFVARDCADTCRSLCLVSSWVRDLVLPHHSPTIVIMSPEDAMKLERIGTGVSCTAWTSPMVHTKHLWLDSAVCSSAKNGNLAMMLSKFSNITHLAVSGDHFLQMLELGIQFSKKSLDITVHAGTLEKHHRLEEGIAIYIQHRLLRSVVKLTFGNFPNVETLRTYLKAFCCLTALTVNFLQPNPSELTNLLSVVQGVPTLKEIVIAMPKQYVATPISCMGKMVWDRHDNRLVVAEPQSRSWMKWKAGIEGNSIEVWGASFEQGHVFQQPI